MGFLTGKWIDIHQIDRKNWALDQKMVWQGNPKHGGDIITIPRGFITDFASIPKIFHSWMGPMGIYMRAAILHDWLLRLLRMGMSKVSARDIDGIFRKVCQDEGVNVFLARQLWVGVRLGALRTPERRQGWGRDAVSVTFWGLLGLPIVLPMIAGVGLGLLLGLIIQTVVLIIGKGVTKWSAVRAGRKGSSIAPASGRTGHSAAGDSARRLRR